MALGKEAKPVERCTMYREKTKYRAKMLNLVEIGTWIQK
jgi:hypothetical protein